MKDYYMYNRANVYLHNNKRVQITWFQFKHKGHKSVVIKEAHTEGPSLTNSIENAIERIIYIMKEPVTIYQDCGDEGIFKVDYSIRFGDQFRPDETLEVGQVSWHHFSKDLTSLRLLYGQD